MNRFGQTKEKKISKGKTEYNAEDDANKSAYRNADGKLFTPATHIEGTLTKSAASFTMPGKGKKSFKDAIMGGVFVEPDEIIHKIQDWSIDSRRAKIGRAAIIRSRTKLDKWELDFKLNIRDENLTESQVKEILENAGKYIGIGDYRPRFGRFEIVKFDKVD